MRRRKFESIRGSFPCKYCGTIYLWSDQRDKCEGREYFREEPCEYTMLDELDVSIGDTVILTRYVGEDYAPEGYRCGIHLVWKYVKIKDKRIVYGNFSHRGETYLHYAEYKFEDEKNQEVIDILGERWDVTEAGSYTPGFAIGPLHVWTESLVREQTSEPWENYVKNMCVGPNTPETLKKLAKEGFYIYGISK